MLVFWYNLLLLGLKLGVVKIQHHLLLNINPLSYNRLHPKVATIIPAKQL